MISLQGMANEYLSRYQKAWQKSWTYNKNNSTLFVFMDNLNRGVFSQVWAMGMQLHKFSWQSYENELSILGEHYSDPSGGEKMSSF